MRILGIDPGLAAAGWGLIVHPEGGPRDVVWGQIKTSSDAAMSQRLQKIFHSLQDLVRDLRPEAVRFTLRCSDGYRIPKPTRLADQYVGMLRRGECRMMNDE